MSAARIDKLTSRISFWRLEGAPYVRRKGAVAPDEYAQEDDTDDRQTGDVDDLRGLRDTVHLVLFLNPLHAATGEKVEGHTLTSFSK